MTVRKKQKLPLIIALTAALTVSGCGAVQSAPESVSENTESTAVEDSVHSAVNFEHQLDPYKPKKDHYNFYFTYKTVHS
ncbi:MAG: hypothetical protein K6F87_02285 [Lachnospiraceae bacterium]|nr:hypothetical protein [Lachnospiraceae bacterium]